MLQVIPVIKQLTFEKRDSPGKKTTQVQDTHKDQVKNGFLL